MKYTISADQSHWSMGMKLQKRTHLTLTQNSDDTHYATIVVSDTTTTVATNFIKSDLSVLRIKFVKGDLSLRLLAKCKSGSSFLVRG